MGFRVRKSIKIAPGIKLNIGKKGINSVSMGGHGYTKNISKKGTRTTVGIPGTGISYSNYKKRKTKQQIDEEKYRDRLRPSEKIAKGIVNLELKYNDEPFEVHSLKWFSRGMVIETILTVFFYILAAAANIGFIMFGLVFNIILVLHMLFSKNRKLSAHKGYAVKNYQFSKWDKCIYHCDKVLEKFDDEELKKLRDLAQDKIDKGVKPERVEDEDVIKSRE